jgi:hypothetical protein
MSGDRRVERMIMESFRETMTLIENAIQTRVRGKGRDGVERDCDRYTSNMMYAAFVHRETRPVEGISERTKIDFFDAVAEVKGALGFRTRERKSQRKLSVDELLNNWRSQMTPEELASLSPEAVRAALPENLLEADTAKGLAIQHLFERVSVVRELHATAMLLRRGIGGVSIDEALEFARSDLRLLRAGGGLVTTLEVLAEESAMLERVQAGRGRYEEIRRSGDWTFLSPLLGGRTEESSAQGAALQGYGYLCPGSGR